jgi:DNA segregation ATPase FtsK/SpoIIIE, S-DNA-T family
VAKRKTSRAGSPFAKVIGALLIALALLIAVSLVPVQTAPVPRLVAARLGQAVGRGLPVLPAMCLFFGLIFFVRESLRLSRRIFAVLLGYLVVLSVLHIRYPAGREYIAAAGRKGGGYIGALVDASLRKTVGEPGLWTATLLGGVAVVVLFSGRSATEALRATGRAAQLTGRVLWEAARHAAMVGTAKLRDVLGPLPGALWHGAELAAAGAVAGWAHLVYAARHRESRFPGPRPFPTQAGSGADAPESGPQVTSVTLTAGEFERSSTAEIPARSPEPVDATASDVAVALENETGRTESRPGRQRRKSAVEQELLVLPTASREGYALPPFSLLETYAGGKARGKVEPDEVAQNLERTLASFGVEARVIRWEVGPVVTRYELQPAPGVKVQRITSLQNDIALALAASSVRLEAPIPGKAAIGVELPNDRPGLVHLREILTSQELQRSASPLAVSIGKGIAGQPIVADLVAMPHLLIAGATGAGKSVALNSMIATILFRATPAQVRFLMIDPKRVELANYNGIPHLLSPVVIGPREAAAKLRWAIQEMESRYGLFAAEGVRNIQSFNAQYPDRPLAYIVIIIDELADLMMVAPSDFEEIICRLAQMTRAVGIHLVLATQRPSVDVITGLIKANIPSRIAFAVTSQVDSRTILDHPGAEKLLGRGDMLFSPIGATRPTRVQGSYISDAESQRLVEFWRAQGQPEYAEDLVRAGDDTAPEADEGDDSLLADAARLVVRAGYGSVSLLQRKMRIGYVRAARLVDQLEERRIVGPAQGSSPREVMVGIDELEKVLRGGRVHATKAPEAKTGPGKAAPAAPVRTAQDGSAKAPQGGPAKAVPGAPARSSEPPLAEV